MRSFIWLTFAALPVGTQWLLSVNASSDHRTRLSSHSLRELNSASSQLRDFMDSEWHSISGKISLQEAGSRTQQYLHCEYLPESEGHAQHARSSVKQQTQNFSKRIVRDRRTIPHPQNGALQQKCGHGECPYMREESPAGK